MDGDRHCQVVSPGVPEAEDDRHDGDRSDRRERTREARRGQQYPDAVDGDEQQRRDGDPDPGGRDAVDASLDDAAEQRPVP